MNLIQIYIRSAKHQDRRGKYQEPGSKKEESKILLSPT